MDLVKSISERLIQQFEDAKVKGAHQFAPRDGYYYINDVYYKFIGKFEVPVACVNWKPNLEGAFLKEVSFEIALVSLRLADDENAVVCYPTLKGLTIKISDCVITMVDVKGKTIPMFKCKYIVVAITSVFWSKMDIMIASLGNDEHSLNDAVTEQLHSVGLDLSSFDYEAGTPDPDNNPNTDTLL